MELYLKTDIIGAASGIVYGKQGDKVTVLKQDHDMALVEKDEIFHVKLEKLSDEFIPKEINQSVPMKAPKKKK